MLGLFDTGASVSGISWNAVKLYKLQNKLVRVKETFKTANGKGERMKAIIKHAEITVDK